MTGYLWYDKPDGGHERGYDDTGYREVSGEHEACYQVRIGRVWAEVEQGRKTLKTVEVLAKDYKAAAQAEALASAERELDV